MTIDDAYNLVSPYVPQDVMVSINVETYWHPRGGGRGKVETDVSIYRADQHYTAHGSTLDEAVSRFLLKFAREAVAA